MPDTLEEEKNNIFAPLEPEEEKEPLEEVQPEVEESPKELEPGIFDR
jgi:hypothetical protein